MRTTVLMAVAVVAVGCTDLQSQQTEPTEPRGEVASQQAALTTTVRRARANGALIDTGWADTLQQGFLMVATDTANPGVALVTYNNIAYDPTSNVCTTDPVLGEYCHLTRVTFESGSGYIALADVQIGSNTARLTTDLATATNLFFNSCIYDEVAGTNLCTTAPRAGGITLTWQKTRTDYIKHFGVTETKIGPEITRVSGSRQQYSADVNGNVMGIPIVHQIGNLGSTSSTTIEITRTP